MESQPHRALSLAETGSPKGEIPPENRLDLKEDKQGWQGDVRRGDIANSDVVTITASARLGCVKSFAIDYQSGLFRDFTDIAQGDVMTLRQGNDGIEILCRHRQ